MVERGGFFYVVSYLYGKLIIVWKYVFGDFLKEFLK